MLLEDGNVVKGFAAYRAGRFTEAAREKDAQRVLSAAQVQSNEAFNRGQDAQARAAVAAAGSGLTVDGSALANIAGLASQTETERQKVIWSGREEATALKVDGREAAKVGRYALASSLVLTSFQTGSRIASMMTGNPAAAAAAAGGGGGSSGGGAGP